MINNERVTFHAKTCLCKTSCLASENVGWWLRSCHSFCRWPTHHPSFWSSCMATSNPPKWVEIFRHFFPHCHLSKKELSDKESWAPRKCMNSQVASAPFLRQLMMRKCSPSPSCEGMVPELEEQLAPKTSFTISFPILRFYHFCRPHSEKWKDKSCIWKPHRITIYQKKKKKKKRI